MNEQEPAIKFGDRVSVTGEVRKSGDGLRIERLEFSVPAHGVFLGFSSVGVGHWETEYIGEYGGRSFDYWVNDKFIKVMKISEDTGQKYTKPINCFPDQVKKLTE